MRTILGMALLLFGTVTVAGAVDGAAIYSANCAKCHGDTGQADTPAGKALKAPALAGDAKVAATADGDLVQLIKGNKKHASVLGKLADADIAAAASHVKELAGGK